MINSVMSTMNSLLGTPQLSQPSSNVTRRRRQLDSNSTRCLVQSDYTTDGSNDLEESINISPVKTSRQNTMSIDSSDSSSFHSNKISIDLKHHVDTINLDNPLNMKVAMQYLLEKVRDNETLLIAVSKENREMSKEINQLYIMKDALTTENQTLKKSIDMVQQNQQRCSEQKVVNEVDETEDRVPVDFCDDIELLKTKTFDFINDICEWKGEVETNMEMLRQACSKDMETMECSLRGEINTLSNELDEVKTKCSDDKDDLCKSIMMDFQQIEYRLTETEMKLSSHRGVLSPENGDQNVEVPNRGEPMHMAKLQEEVQKIKTAVNLNEIVLDVIKEEHSDQIDILKEKMIKVERELTVTNQYNRRENLIIDGIPDHVPQWQLERTCLQIIHKIGFRGVGPYEVVGCHRLRKTVKDATTPVIIRFTNRKIAEFCKSNKWRLKKINFNNWQLSLREDLCDTNSGIFNECEILKERGLISKVFTYNGFVKVCKDRDERPRKLSHMDDVRSLLDDA